MEEGGRERRNSRLAPPTEHKLPSSSKLRPTANPQMVPPLGNYLGQKLRNQKREGQGFGSRLEGGREVFGFGHEILFLCTVFTMRMC